MKNIFIEDIQRRLNVIEEMDLRLNILREKTFILRWDMVECNSSSPSSGDGFAATKWSPSSITHCGMLSMSASASVVFPVDGAPTRTILVTRSW